jgi:raffinose/stachyose/melibiose transport system permease protein
VGSLKKSTTLFKNSLKTYPVWFTLPIGAIFITLFVIPTFTSFYFSTQRWTLFDTEFIGLENYIEFFRDPNLQGGLVNTFIYAFLTSGLKVVIGIFLGVVLMSSIRFRALLRNIIFFPVLVSTIGVGLTFQSLLKPDAGILAEALSVFGIPEEGLLGNFTTVLYAIIAVDVWKGVGLATVIFIAGMAAIPQEYYEAAKVDGVNGWQNFKHIVLPLLRPATNTVIILSLISGFRTFDLIWAMSGGGPGYASDVLASLVFKQYQTGFYGLSTAGNVIMFILILVLILPLQRYLQKKEQEIQ